jgi:hypothetical protein
VGLLARSVTLSPTYAPRASSLRTARSTSLNSRALVSTRHSVPTGRVQRNSCVEPDLRIAGDQGIVGKRFVAQDGGVYQFTCLSRLIGMECSVCRLKKPRIRAF